MNGATIEPWVNIIKPPKSVNIKIIGSNQYFFLTFKNSKNSLIKLILIRQIISYFFKNTICN